MYFGIACCALRYNGIWRVILWDLGVVWISYEPTWKDLVLWQVWRSPFLFIFSEVSETKILTIISYMGENRFRFHATFLTPSDALLIDHSRALAFRRFRLCFTSIRLLPLVFKHKHLSGQPEQF